MPQAHARSGFSLQQQLKRALFIRHGCSSCHAAAASSVGAGGASVDDDTASRLPANWRCAGRIAAVLSRWTAASVTDQSGVETFVSSLLSLDMEVKR